MAMYKSKRHIESKLAQAKFVLNEMRKYRGKLFVNNGIDPETGAYPLQVNIGSFLAHARSVFQYAYKESKERNMVCIYEVAVNKRPIIGVFKELRDTDIHEMPIGTGVIISDTVHFHTTDNPEKEKYKAELKETHIVNHLLNPIVVTKAIVEQLRKDGRIDLVGVADSGGSLHETVELDGEEDLYILCEKYIESLDDFVLELVRAGVVT